MTAPNTSQMKKREILFTCDPHTTPKQLRLLSLLAASFDGEHDQTHLLKLDGSRPDKVFQNFIMPIKRRLCLHFNLDCLGFDYQSFGETPYYNTLWTPCVTFLTRPAKQFHALLAQEWNLNITVLCPETADLAVLKQQYPEISDFRTVPDPFTDAAPLASLLHSIAERQASSY